MNATGTRHLGRIVQHLLRQHDLAAFLLRLQPRHGRQQGVALGAQVPVGRLCRGVVDAYQDVALLDSYNFV